MSVSIWAGWCWKIELFAIYDKLEHAVTCRWGYELEKSAMWIILREKKHWKWQDFLVKKISKSSLTKKKS